MGTLYTELAGAASVERIVDRHYEHVMADDRLSPFFENVDLASQRHKFRLFLNTITGGPGAVSALELRAAHAHSVDHGLDQHHFDAFVDHLETAMKECEVPTEVVDRILGKIADYQSDVLGW